jgi:hypothetical protein
VGGTAVTPLPVRRLHPHELGGRLPWWFFPSDPKELLLGAVHGTLGSVMVTRRPSSNPSALGSPIIITSRTLSSQRPRVESRRGTAQEQLASREPKSIAHNLRKTRPPQQYGRPCVPIGSAGNSSLATAGAFCQGLHPRHLLPAPKWARLRRWLDPSPSVAERNSASGCSHARWRPAQCHESCTTAQLVYGLGACVGTRDA